MTNDIMNSYKEFIALYNQYRSSGNNEAAVRMARQIVDTANRQCERGDIPQQFKEYYSSSSAPVREWLADIRMGGISKKRKVNPDDEDKIKSTDWFGADIPDLTMRDVAGLSELRNEFLVNIFAPISPKYSPIYKKYRKDVGLQILMYGPPGCGKTHIVKCLAGSLGCKIAVVQVKDVMANLVGDGAKIISEIFEQAQKYEKCIIFFDEIDAIAASRDDEESRHTKEQLTTLLTNMDGFMSATMGLTVKDIEILRILDEYTGDAMGADVLAARAGLDTKKYMSEYEKYLIKIGFINISGKGRALSEKAVKYLHNGCGQNVSPKLIEDNASGDDIQSRASQEPIDDLFGD